MSLWKDGDEILPYPAAIKINAQAKKNWEKTLKEAQRQSKDDDANGTTDTSSSWWKSPSKPKPPDTSSIM
jgi:hypothetical protein